MNIRGFEEFTEVEVVKKARHMEMESDWVVVVINGPVYDSAWITEREGSVYEKAVAIYT